MRHIKTVLFLCVVAVLILTACGAKATPTAAPNQPPAATPRCLVYNGRVKEARAGHVSEPQARHRKIICTYGEGSANCVALLRLASPSNP